MREKKTGRYKREPDGAGESITVKFVMEDPMEMQALLTAQYLAQKHGRRKEYILALLRGLEAVNAVRGSYPTPFEVEQALRLLAVHH